MTTLKLSVLACAAIVTGLMSCGKEEVPAPPPNPSVTVTDSIEVPFSSTASYTLFSFKNGAVVANSDSISTDWDFGLTYVNFIVNSHASGPGNGGVITEIGLYDTLSLAPATGYAYDTTTNATQLAINNGLTTGWYNYDLTTHNLSPKAGLYFVFRTADNHYAKMEVLSVGYSGYNGPNSPPTTLIYKFQYSYQSDGSGNF